MILKLLYIVYGKALWQHRHIVRIVVSGGTTEAEVRKMPALFGVVRITEAEVRRKPALFGVLTGLAGGGGGGEGGIGTVMKVWKGISSWLLKKELLSYEPLSFPAAVI